jgi:ribosomal protein L40E
MELQCSFSGLAALDQSNPEAVQALLRICMGMLFDPTLLKWLVGITLGCAVVGAIIGHAKGRWLAGLLWGAALGPIGWLVIILSKSGLIECVDCGRSNVPDAKACRHCGINLRAAAQRSERSQLKRMDRTRGW